MKQPARISIPHDTETNDLKTFRHAFSLSAGSNDAKKTRITIEKTIGVLA